MTTIYLIQRHYTEADEEGYAEKVSDVALEFPAHTDRDQAEALVEKLNQELVDRDYIYYQAGVHAQEDWRADQLRLVEQARAEGNTRRADWTTHLVEDNPVEEVLDKETWLSTVYLKEDYYTVLPHELRTT